MGSAPPHRRAGGNPIRKANAIIKEDDANENECQYCATGFTRLDNHDTCTVNSSKSKAHPSSRRSIKDPSIYVGRKVQAKFSGTPWTGKVTGYSRVKKEYLWQVEYTDGDTEDNTLAGLEAILVPYFATGMNRKRPKQQTGPATAKRPPFYKDKIKRKFREKEGVYQKFLDILKELQTPTVDTLDVIRRVVKLLEGRTKLIVGFNIYLPRGIVIIAQDSQFLVTSTEDGGVTTCEELVERAFVAPTQSIQQKGSHTSITSTTAVGLEAAHAPAAFDEPNPKRARLEEAVTEAGVAVAAYHSEVDDSCYGMVGPAPHLTTDPPTTPTPLLHNTVAAGGGDDMCPHPGRDPGVAAVLKRARALSDLNGSQAHMLHTRTTTLAPASTSTTPLNTTRPSFHPPRSGVKGYEFALLERQCANTVRDDANTIAALEIQVEEQTLAREDAEALLIREREKVDALARDCTTKDARIAELERALEQAM
jgi:hypothetical protein